MQMQDVPLRVIITGSFTTAQRLNAMKPYFVSKDNIKQLIEFYTDPEVNNRHFRGIRFVPERLDDMENGFPSSLIQTDEATQDIANDRTDRKQPKLTRVFLSIIVHSSMG